MKVETLEDVIIECGTYLIIFPPGFQVRMKLRI